MNIWIVLTSLITSYLIDNSGAIATFLLFGTLSVFGFFYLIFFVKDSSKSVFENGVERKMTEKEKKNLYFP